MTPSPVHETAPEPASRGRILLVEDDPDAALFATHILTRRGGFDVTHTPDPVVALALAAEQSWDLVVTDLDLPTMTGLEMITALRRMVPMLPVVVVTAEPREEWPRFGDGCGPDAILAKPVLADALLAAVSAVILTAPYGGQWVPGADGVSAADRG
jgi:DNA-binding response OmpR family regulator